MSNSGECQVIYEKPSKKNRLKWTLKFVERFVAYVTDYMVELEKRETEADQDSFWIAEPLASLLALKRFWKFSWQYLKKIYDAADVPWFLHVCGKTTQYPPYMVQLGAEVLSIDYGTNIGECIRMVDENMQVLFDLLFL